MEIQNLQQLMEALHPLTGTFEHPPPHVSCAILRSTHSALLFNMHLHRMRIKVTHWNVAGVNNNPFEYWMDSTGTGDPATTAAEEAYTQLMMDAEAYITKQKKLSLNDTVKVKSLLTPKMYNELSALMAAKGWTGIKETRKYFDTRTCTAVCLNVIRGPNYGEFSHAGAVFIFGGRLSYSNW